MTDSKIDDGGPVFPVHPEMAGLHAAKFVRRVDGADWSREKCWVWTGAKSKKGYGIFSLSKRAQMRAHRFALYVFNNRMPSQYVLHECDNPPCVNPHHLKEGTHGDNMREMAERRRATRHERHHKAKLSFAEALAISILHRSGDYTTQELGEMFNVSKATAISVASGKLWRDATELADAMLAKRSKQRSA